MRNKVAGRDINWLQKLKENIATPAFLSGHFLQTSLTQTEAAAIYHEAEQLAQPKQPAGPRGLPLCTSHCAYLPFSGPKTHLSLYSPPESHCTRANFNQTL